MPYPLQALEIRRPTGGLNDTAPIDGVGPDEATLAENVDFDRGTLASRRGRKIIGDRIQPAEPWTNARNCYGGVHFRKRDGSSQLLVVNGGLLYKLTGSTWAGAVSGLNPATVADRVGGGVRNVTWIQYNDRVYFADGDYWKRYDGSAIVDWSYAGGALGAAVLSAAIATGALGDGEYSAVYTLYDSSVGEETNPSAASNRIDTAATGLKIPIAIALPAGWSARFNKVRIYRTSVDGDGAWYFEKEVAAAFPISDFLTISDATLGTEAAFDNDPVPAVKYVIMHDERAIGLGNPASPSTVYYSKKGAPFSWPTGNAQDLLKDDGHPGSGLFILFGQLFATKLGGPVFQLSPHPIFTYAPQQLPAKAGCASHYSIVTDENFAYWWDVDGFFRFNGQQTENISDAKIRTTVRDLAQSAEAWNERVFGIIHREADRRRISWAFVPLNFTTEGIVVVKDLATEGAGWHIEKYDGQGNFMRVFFPVEDANRTARVYAGDNQGHIFRLRTDEAGNELYTDNDYPIRTKIYGAWLGGIEDSVPRYIDIELERSPAGKGDGVFTLKTWIDGVAGTVLRQADFPLFDAGPLTRVVSMNLPSTYAKRIRVGFEVSSLGVGWSVVRYAIRGIPIGRRQVGV